MPWTKITREQYRRDKLRYASNMTDAEWALIKCLLPRSNRRGRPRKTDLRRVVEAVLYILSTGCRPTRRYRAIFMLGVIRAGGKGSSAFLSGAHEKNSDARRSRRQR